MNEINRANLRILTEEIEAALAPIGKKHGVGFKRGGGRFDSTSFTLKIEGALSGNGVGAPVDVDEENYRNKAASFGLKPEWLGESFNFGGKTYTVVGLQPRRYKRPVVGMRNGKKFIFDTNSVISALGSSAPAPSAPDNEILREIAEIVVDMDKVQKIGYSDWARYDKAAKAAWDRITALDTKVGAGLQVGRLLKFSVADGYACYIVTEIGTREVKVKHIPLHDGYEFSGAWDNGRGDTLIPIQVAEKTVGWSDAAKQIFAKKS